MIAGACRCIDCLRTRKPYELGEDGRCAVCERLFRPVHQAPAPFPTNHPPGTLGKVVMLEWRRERGFDLYHPGDAVEDARGNGPSRFREDRRIRKPPIARCLAKCG
jgi:hypothetical protein